MCLPSSTLWLTRYVTHTQSSVTRASTYGGAPISNYGRVGVSTSLPWHCMACAPWLAPRSLPQVCKVLRALKDTNFRKISIFNELAYAAKYGRLAAYPRELGRVVMSITHLYRSTYTLGAVGEYISLQIDKVRAVRKGTPTVQSQQWRRWRPQTMAHPPSCPLPAHLHTPPMCSHPIARTPRGAV